MGRSIHKPPADSEAENERLADELRHLYLEWLWPYKTDRATAGTSSPSSIDDSPYSLRRERFHRELGEEMARLKSAGLPLREQLDGAKAWIAERLGEDGEHFDDYFKTPKWQRDHGLIE